MGLIVPGTAFATPRVDLADAYQQWNGNGVEYMYPSVFPDAQSDVASGEIALETLASLLSEDNMDREAGGTFNQIDIELAKMLIAIRGKGLEIAFNYDDGRNLTYNFELGAARRLRQKVDTNFERAARAILFAAGLPTTAATAAWSAATGVPITDMGTAKAAFFARTGLYPNAVVMNGVQRDTLVTNAQMTGRFPGSTRLGYQDVVGSLNALFGISNVIISTAVYNSAAKGLTPVLTSVVPNTHIALALIASPGAPIETACVGRNLIYTDPDEGSLDVLFEQYYWAKTHSEIYRVRCMKQINEFKATTDTYSPLIQLVATGLT
jgi:hypothetical protein